MTETVKTPNIYSADTTLSPNEEGDGAIDNLDSDRKEATELNTETTEQAFES